MQCFGFSCEQLPGFLFVRGGSLHHPKLCPSKTNSSYCMYVVHYTLYKAGLSGQGNCWPWIKEMAAVKHLLNLGGFSPFAIHHRLVWEGCISSLEEVLEFSTETDSNFCDMKPSTFLQVCYWIDGHKVAAAVAHKHTLWRKRQCLRVRLNWLQPQDRQNLKWYPLTLALHDGQQMSAGINVSKMFLRFPALRLFWAWTERQRWSHSDNKT